MNRAQTNSSSLVVGERVVSRCAGALLEVEYALFEADDVIVTAQLGFGAREQGYLTTAGLARERLRAMGIHAMLVADTFEAFRAAPLRTLARAPFVVPLLDQLTAYEAFEGGTFDAATHTYEGTWLDLRALAQTCALATSSLILQALHLLLVVEEVPPDVPVRLLTAELTADRRPGTRTWTRVRLDAAPRLPAALRAIRGAPPRPPLPRHDDEQRLRDALVAHLRSRATAAGSARARLRSLATLLAKPVEIRSSALPTLDSLESASAALRNTPQPRPDTPVSVGSLPDVLPLFEELRRHTELLRGDAHIREVAKFLSAMSDKPGNVPDLAILAARAWLASGEPGHARHLAKELVSSLATPESVRLTALEILKATAPTNESEQPPPIAMIEPTPIVMLASEPDRDAPAGASLPPFEGTDADAVVMQDGEAHERGWDQEPARTNADSTPPTDGVQPRAPSDRPPFRLGRAEIVEGLALPPGLREDMLPEDRAPTTPDEVRIAMTRQARTLGRDYRLWYGTTLKTNAMAIEAMQRHLRRRFGDGKLDEKTTKKLEVELTRHGALLSEILARILGGTWTDVSPAEQGRWAMTLGADVRVWPIGRVYRFFRQGHREADLVAFYLDLENGLLGGTK